MTQSRPETEHMARESRRSGCVGGGGSCGPEDGRRLLRRRRLFPAAAATAAALVLVFGAAATAAAAAVAAAEDASTRSVRFVAPRHDRRLMGVLRYVSSKLSVNGGRGGGADWLRLLAIDDHAQPGYRSDMMACQSMLPETVVVISGELRQQTVELISSVCKTFRLPHVIAAADRPADNNGGDSRKNGAGSVRPDMTLSLYPDVSDAVLALIKEWRWTSVVILYQARSGAYDAVAMTKRLQAMKIHWSLVQISYSSVNAVVKQIESDRLGPCFYVVADSILTKRFCQLLSETHLLGGDNSFIFSSLDFTTIPMGYMSVLHANLSGFSAIDLDSHNNRLLLKELREFQEERGLMFTSIERDLKVGDALAYDAAAIVKAALKYLPVADDLSPLNLTCDNPGVIFELGEVLYKYLSRTSTHGLTGRISLSNGRRVHANFDVYQIADGGDAVKIYKYHEKHLYPTDNYWRLSQSSGKRQILKVTAILDAPYVMLSKQARGQQSGSGLIYEGFCIDMMNEIAEILDFSYEIELCVNCSYGAADSNGNWGGMTRAIIDKKADVGIGPFTITHEREQVIDFTKPFMVLGISILFRASTAVGDAASGGGSSSRPGLFSFLQPLAAETWACIVVAYVLVSVVLCLLGHCSPYEWYRRRRHDLAGRGVGSDPDGDRVSDETSAATVTASKATAVALASAANAATAAVTTTAAQKAAAAATAAAQWPSHSRLTAINSFWFSVSTLMQQGSDVMPRATSTRIAGGVWWLFTLIIISSYTANLAAFLTSERLAFPIQNAQDLAGQVAIQYGTVANGSTMTFFKRSSVDYHQRMWNFMSSNPSVIVRNYDEGVMRVKQGGYAFLMESTSLDYRVQQDCELVQVGGLIDNKGYGLGTPMGSRWTEKFSMAILKLQEAGHLQKIYDRWWKQPGGCAGRITKVEAEIRELAMSNIGGIFIILLASLVIALLVGLGERLWVHRHQPQQQRLPISEQRGRSPLRPTLRFRRACSAAGSRSLNIPRLFVSAVKDDEQYCSSAMRQQRRPTLLRLPGRANLISPSSQRSTQQATECCAEAAVVAVDVTQRHLAVSGSEASSSSTVAADTGIDWLQLPPGVTLASIETLGGDGSAAGGSSRAQSLAAAPAGRCSRETTYEQMPCEHLRGDGLMLPPQPDSDKS